MSAGTGISHSEFNPSQTEPVHFLQIWIVPDKTGLLPGYEQQAFPLDRNRGRWTLIASKEGRDGSVTVHQDVDVSAALLSRGQPATYRLKAGRHAWIHVARGRLSLNGTSLNAGEGAGVSQEEILEVSASDPAEILLFDLA
jgi:redox-sensitive bicupin YhaK (pirin superfamily)